MNKKIFSFFLIAALMSQTSNCMLRRVAGSLQVLKRNCGRGLRRLSTKPSKNTNDFVTRAELNKVYTKFDALNRALAKLAINHDDPWRNVRSAFGEELDVLKGAIKNVHFRMLKQEQDMKDLEFFMGNMFDRIQDDLPRSVHNKSLVPISKKSGSPAKFNDLTLHELVHKAVQIIPNESAKKHVINEIKRLEDKELHTSEKADIRSYVKYIFDMPWQHYSQDEKDIKKAHQILDEDHFGMIRVKDHILDEIAVKNFKKEGTMPIMCLVGQPGTGKTSIGKSIARALGRKYVRVALGGVGDESELRGHRKTYVGSRPGRIVQAIKNCGVANPVLLFDEIDKVSSRGRGDLSAALLEVLDPEQNKYFVDRYLEIPFDLSQVLFVVTANDWNAIAKPLQDRMEKIQISGYSIDEKVEIAQRYLWPKQLKDVGLEVENVSLSGSTIKYIVTHYADEHGVRQLDRCLRKLARKSVRALQENGKLPEFSQETIIRYFGKSRADDMSRHIL